MLTATSCPSVRRLPCAFHQPVFVGVLQPLLVVVAVVAVVAVGVIVIVVVVVVVVAVFPFHLLLFPPLLQLPPFAAFNSHPGIQLPDPPPSPRPSNKAKSEKLLEMCGGLREGMGIDYVLARPSGLRENAGTAILCRGSVDLSKMEK